MRDDLAILYNAMKPTAPGTDWVQQVDDLTQALTYAVGTENPFASESGPGG